MQGYNGTNGVDGINGTSGAHVCPLYLENTKKAYRSPVEGWGMIYACIMLEYLASRTMHTMVSIL